MKTACRFPGSKPARFAVAASGAIALGQLLQAAPAALDTRPAFMLIETNVVRFTNVVVVTNYVVQTNVWYKTNLYNAQGQLLQPVPSSPPPIPGLIPIPQTTPAAPAGPDPALVKANQAQAIKDLLLLGLSAASNKLGAAESFTENSSITIPFPSGVTSFDRKKSQALATAMNTAAKQAVPQAYDVVQKAVARFKPDDPAQSLKEGNDAATRLLLATEGQTMAAELVEVVRQTASAARVPEAYSAVMLKGGGLLGAVLGSGSSVDINAHITQSLMEAMFKEIGGEEQRIRSTPAARKTKALQEALK